MQRNAFECLLPSPLENGRLTDPQYKLELLWPMAMAASFDVSSLLDPENPGLPHPQLLKALNQFRHEERIAEENWRPYMGKFRQFCTQWHKRMRNFREYQRLSVLGLMQNNRPLPTSDGSQASNVARLLSYRGMRVPPAEKRKKGLFDGMLVGLFLGHPSLTMASLHDVSSEPPRAGAGADDDEPPSALRK